MAAGAIDLESLLVLKRQLVMSLQDGPPGGWGGNDPVQTRYTVGAPRHAPERPTRFGGHWRRGGTRRRNRRRAVLCSAEQRKSAVCHETRAHTTARRLPCNGYGLELNERWGVFAPFRVVVRARPGAIAQRQTVCDWGVSTSG